MVQNEIKMRKPKSRELIHALVQDWRLYVLLLPVVLWFALWAYKPMGGLLIAFKRYDSSLGIWMSEFKGIDNFVNLVAGVNKEQFWQAFRNTFVINAYSLVFGFPVPIILAVLFSEIGNGFVRKATQTATYLPHFLSEVTITGITIMLVYSGVHSTGVLAALFQNMGWLEEGVSMLSKANYFRPLYIAVGIWKESGYSSIGDLKPYCLQLDTSRAMQYKRLLEQADRYKQMELPLEHPKESTTYMGIAIANLALAYRLSGSEQYLQDAKRFMNTVLSYEKWGNAHLVNVDLSASWILFGLSLGYDWLKPYLSEEEKQRIFCKIRHHAKVMFDYRRDT